MKRFYIKYTCTVTRSAYVEAENEKEARDLFDTGKFQELRDLDCHDIELKSIEEDVDDFPSDPAPAHEGAH